MKAYIFGSYGNHSRAIYDVKTVQTASDLRDVVTALKRSSCSNNCHFILGSWSSMGPVRIRHTSFTRFWMAVQSFCGSRWVASQNGFHWNLDTTTYCAQAPFPSPGLQLGATSRRWQLGCDLCVYGSSSLKQTVRWHWLWATSWTTAWDRRPFSDWAGSTAQLCWDVDRLEPCQRRRKLVKRQRRLQTLRGLECVREVQVISLRADFWSTFTIPGMLRV